MGPEQEKVVLTRANFAPGTLGFEVFPQILEGRLRPRGVFDQPIFPLLELPRGQVVNLERRGVKTFSDLLNFPLEQLTKIRGWQFVKHRLQSYNAGRLSYGAEGLVLMVMFDIQQENAPILPVKFEEERNRQVSEALDSLDVNQSKEILLGDIIRKHFGIDDGKVRDLKQVSMEVNIPRIRLRDMERLAFTKLLHSYGTTLSLYAPLPLLSLGRALWQVDFGCQIDEQLVSLDIKELTAEDIYPAGYVQYLRFEYPGLVANWDTYSSMPLSLLLRASVDELPGILFEMKDALQSPR